MMSYGSGFLKTLTALMLAASFWSWTAGAAMGEVPEKRLRGDYQRLKRHFEEQIRETSDPKAASCLSAETSAISWLLAAANLSVDIDDARKWLNLADEFERTRGGSQNWDARHLAALEFYYQGLVQIIPLLLSNTGQSVMLPEMEQIVNKTDEQLSALDGKPDALQEKRVTVSGALVSLMSVMVGAVGGGSMEQPVRGILNNVVTKADYISKRPDIHYRAKLSLLYANNIQGLTALVFLLGQNAGPPLSSELAVIHGTMNQHSADLNLPDALSLTWVAQAQAVLPLAFWLGVNYRPAE